MTRISDEGREIDEVWLQTMFEEWAQCVIAWDWRVYPRTNKDSEGPRTTACCTAFKNLGLYFLEGHGPDGKTNENENHRSAIGRVDRRNVPHNDILGSRCKPSSRPFSSSEWASDNCTPLRLWPSDFTTPSRISQRCRRARRPRKPLPNPYARTAIAEYLRNIRELPPFSYLLCFDISDRFYPLSHTTNVRSRILIDKESRVAY